MLVTPFASDARWQLLRRWFFLAAAPAAAIAYGGWAGLVNALAGNPAWLLVLVSHGAYAFTLTLIADRLTRRLHRRLPALTTLGLMSALTVLLPVAIQLAAGNSRIGLSLAPGLVIGHGFLIAVLLDDRQRVRQAGALT